MKNISPKTSEKEVRDFFSFWYGRRPLNVRSSLISLIAARSLLSQSVLHPTPRKAKRPQSHSKKRRTLYSTVHHFSSTDALQVQRRPPSCSTIPNLVPRRSKYPQVLAYPISPLAPMRKAMNQQPTGARLSKKTSPVPALWRNIWHTATF